ncbi:ATP-binding protein [Couchioplanes caeruleus]|uniref:AAA ATPase-like protein n=1 Tax=Couchioplanes caeruleus TaxID=56438 RepID=A0A3N1GUN3_9ACTN|nr:ATP-binding protein [Couchioplanes caeruleus]ROP33914.1 AAA ATPase-like protein [Couchioplanes caeruleus]
MPRPERALGDTGDPLVEFAAGLRKLREKAGSPSYRSLAVLANFSAATLAAAAAGRKLPTLQVTRAYVRACGGDVAEWEGRWRVLAGADRPEPSEPVDGSPPYVGLAPFQQGDAELFFGRGQLVADLVRRVSQHRLVVVFGPSGVGKSSLVRAGLMASMSQPAVLMVAGEHPLTDLALHLAVLARVPAGALLDDLTKDPSHAELVVRQALLTETAELLLVVDQFENVFSASVPDGERAAFFAALVALCRADSRTRVVLAVRADHYPRFAEYPDLLAAMQDGQLLVGGMSPAELREAVVKPADRVGARIEGALVSTIVAAVAGRPGALPLASHALLEAWRRRRGTTITLDGYQAAGGVDGAVAATAEGVYRGLDDQERTAVRRLLLRMIDLDDLDGVRGRRVPRSQIDAADLVDRLVDARLLTTDHGSVELAHESLIRAWPRLRRWVEQDRATLRAHRHLADSAAVWQELGYDQGTLYRGNRLAQTRQWTASPSWRSALSPLERRFVDESIRHDAAETYRQGRHRLRRRWLSSVLVGLLTLVTVAGGASMIDPLRCDRDAVGLLDVRTGLLVAAEDGYQGLDAGVLRARTRPDTYGTWEQFQICRLPRQPENFLLRGFAANKRFVSTRPRLPGDAALRLSAATKGPYEWLKAVPATKGEVTLFSIGRNHYLSARRNGPRRYTGLLEATSLSTADATSFRFTPLP